MTIAGSVSSLTCALFLMRDTRWAKRAVLMVSSVCSASGFTVATMIVLQLPPRESRRTEVIMLFRYGMCVRAPLDLSCSALMTISRKKREELMYCASFKVWPLVPVLATRSDPARSTKCSFERLTTSAPCLLASRLMVKMQCERLEVLFIAVSLMARLVSPRNRKFSASSSEATRCIPRFFRWKWPFSSSSMLTFGRSSSLGALRSSASRSKPWSL
mmetsp:Transcript_1917/g.8491  ORF Transcript_1917/g.8491 Transcript_1917/m.8491 type:complete len:216 (+) Transcript_1917:539-1186(+)